MKIEPSVSTIEVFIPLTPAIVYKDVCFLIFFANFRNSTYNDIQTGMLSLVFHPFYALQKPNCKFVVPLFPVTHFPSKLIRAPDMQKHQPIHKIRDYLFPFWSSK